MLDDLIEPKSKSFLSCLDIMGDDSGPGKASPLHVAASKGLHHYIAHLIELGKDANFVDPESRTSLHRAAGKGDHKAVEVLLKHGAGNDTDDHSGLKPLHLAASRNHADVVKILLEDGVDPFTPKSKEDPGNWCGNAAGTKGSTPVLYTCSYGHIESVRILITSLDSSELKSALTWATACGKIEAVFAILESPLVDINTMIDDKTPPHLAVHSHDLQSMRKILDIGANANIKCVGSRATEVT